MANRRRLARLLLCLGAPLLLSAAAPPGLSFQVVDQNGLPVRDAVVEIARPAGDVRAVAFAWRNAMGQRNLQFIPGTLIVPRGSTVAFPNLDTVRHSIYSFSRAARFQIDLYGRDQTRTQRFDLTGSVSLGCKIHDQMRGYIRVVDTPYAARSDGNGMVQIAGLGPGSHEVIVWHPGLRGANQEWRGRITAIAGQRQRLVVPTRPGPAR